MNKVTIEDGSINIVALTQPLLEEPSALYCSALPLQPAQ
jgi:hypothetical protein